MNNFNCIFLPENQKSAANGKFAAKHRHQ